MLGFPTSMFVYTRAAGSIRHGALNGVRCYVFFFQAEDGIRDVAVTGVQTCALPIAARRSGRRSCPTAPTTHATARRSSASAALTRGYDLSMASDVNLTVCADPAALAETAAHLIVDAATEAVRERGRFMLCLAGGETPRATYARLALPVFSERMRWDRTWVFFGDERAVPPDHPESNYRMAYGTLLSRVPIPPAQIFRMCAEHADGDGAAAAYAAALAEAFGTRRGELPRFDVVLLGLGVDGHTASLFPGSPVLREVFRTVAAVHVAAAQIPQRLTLTLPVLNAAARVVFLVAGAEKAKIVRAVLSEQALLPAALVRPTDGELVWLTDRAAAALHPIGEVR